MTEDQPKKETPNFLEINWEKHPDKAILLGMGRSLTYDQLRNRARSLAKSLYSLGIRAGDQVAIMSYNAALLEAYRVLESYQQAKELER